MAMNSAIIICNNHLDWIRRNPPVFVNGLMGRLEQGECDPSPGYARWSGDGMPGVQVVAVEHSSQASVIVMGGNCGKLVSVCGSSSRGSGPASDVDALRAMADKLGYSIRQKIPARSNAPTKPANMGWGDLRANRKKR